MNISGGAGTSNLQKWISEFEVFDCVWMSVIKAKLKPCVGFGTTQIDYLNSSDSPLCNTCSQTVKGAAFQVETTDGPWSLDGNVGLTHQGAKVLLLAPTLQIQQSSQNCCSEPRHQHPTELLVAVEPDWNWIWTRTRTRTLDPWPLRIGLPAVWVHEVTLTIG